MNRLTSLVGIVLMAVTAHADLDKNVAEAALAFGWDVAAQPAGVSYTGVLITVPGSALANGQECKVSLSECGGIKSRGKGGFCMTLTGASNAFLGSAGASGGYFSGDLTKWAYAITRTSREISLFKLLSPDYPPVLQASLVDGKLYKFAARNTKLNQAVSCLVR
jgi:hypothetical protein